MFTKVFRFLFLVGLLSGGVLSAQQTPLPGQLPRVNRSGGTIFRCLFDRSWDALDGDGRPDYWTRKGGTDQGISFPAYLDITIVENRNPFGNFALRMSMEGGGAATFSPKIRVRRGMSYTVSAYVDAEDVVFDDAFILLAFYGDKTAAPILTATSEKVKNTGGWRRLEIGPIVADAPDVESIAVGLLVLPGGGRQDFGARIDFTNVEIRESPTVSLSMPNEHHLFFDHRDIDVRCQLQGVDPSQHTIEFLLEDPYGRVIGRREIEMMIGNKPAAQFVVTDKDDWNVFQGIAVWKNLPIISPGFYRLRVLTPASYIRNLRLPDGVFFEDPLRDTPALTFAVMDSGFFIPNGEFGWNLDGWSLDEIEQKQGVLMQSGISRLKIPAWLPKDAEKEQRRLLNDLCDSLAANQVRLVGLLRPLPTEVRELVKHGPVNAASLFSLDIAPWTESLQPTLRELSLLIKDWQWTSDDDLSIVDIPDFEGHFESLRRTFDRNDYDFGVGFAWNWNRSLPERFSSSTEPEPVAPVSSADTSAETAATGETTARAAESETVVIKRIPRPANEFVALKTGDPLTPDELSRYLARTDTTMVRRFVSLSPLADRDYGLEDRIVDLVRKMILGKTGGAEALFLSRPIDDQVGVLRRDGTPGELFLPWRTTSTLLSGRRFLGSVSMPEGSRNYNFDLGGGQAVMVLWNDRGTRQSPVLETLYLGPEPVLVDVWGRRTLPEQQGREQVIPVTSVPVFVTGVNANIVRLRLGFQLSSKHISSIPNQPNKVPFSMKNDTINPISAQVSVRGPRPGDWTVEPPIQTLSLEPGATGEGAVDISLGNQANTGRRPIRIDVKTQGADPQEFTVYDEIDIGETDAFMEFSSRMNRNGDIEVTQAFVNNGDKVYTYSCRLRIPGRSFQSSRILRQGFGRIEYVYTIRKGRELIDSGVTEITLRAEPVAEGRATPGQPMVYTIPLLSD